MSLFKYALILPVLFLSMPAFSQSIRDVRINEIQVLNTNGFRDEYGQASGWIELYNTGYGKVNVAGCVLKERGKEYRIPKGDPGTVIPTQGYVVFYAGGTSDKGTFHTNFTLDDTDFIELYDMDGNLINRLSFRPADMVDGVSYGWLEDLDGTEKLVMLPATTPGGTNNTVEKISRAEAFRQADPTGIVLTLINIIFVAIALTLLFFVFKYMGNFFVKSALKKAEKAKIKVKPDASGDAQAAGGKKKGMVTNDELAVIAMALFKYSESLHDEETLALTINKVSKSYSPWSSKIYGLRQYPNRK
jgi:Na+-transporting methylmalonyl-CoA/oxaloacetate decarboxylase gamma subunit